MNTKEAKLFQDIRKRAIDLDNDIKQQRSKEEQFQDNLSALAQVTELSELELAELAEATIIAHERKQRRRLYGLLALLACVASGAVGYTAYRQGLFTSPVTSVATPKITVPPGQPVAAQTPAPSAQKTVSVTRVTHPPPKPLIRPSPKPVAKPLKTPLIPQAPVFSKNAGVHMFGVYQGKISAEAEDARRRRMHAAAQQLRSMREEQSGSVAGAPNLWSRATERPMGQVTVEVPNPGYPVILVLAAYEPVHWHLDFPEGGTLEHVILSGYESQRISGISKAIPVMEYSWRTGERNRFYAYKRQDGKFRGAAKIIEQLTGKPVSAFRGEYETGLFRLSPTTATTPQVTERSRPGLRTDAAAPSSRIYSGKNEQGVITFSDKPF